MIFFLNRGLILEQEIVKALKKYFSIVGVPEYYRNYTVSITNEHPFARMLLSEDPKKDAASLLPVIIVATEDDSKPAELAALIDRSDSITIEPEDIAEKDGDKSPIKQRYDMITPQVMAKLREAMNARKDKRIFGTSLFIRRRDRISIEIWAENPQLKNELYEITRLFVCGFMRDYLAELYREYFSEIEDGESPLSIFDSSVRGQRSNNFNLDFGIELSGGCITFEADYIIEQTVIDTALADTNNILLGVINHVKEYEYITRSRVNVGNKGDRNRADGSGDGDTGESEPESEPETEETKS
ncbi:MAG: hypothetical protein LBQ89_08220 [Treponema sp.]|jgi:hypothetical protein|nr:hypothetical protein [Treponema sp.]